MTGARRVLLGLGGNLGDRLARLRHGLRALAADRAIRLEAVSPIYQSDALLPPGAPDDWNRPYLNLAAVATTELEPFPLLARLKAIEVAAGRIPAPRWAPRQLDIDLLAMDGVRLDAPGLRLPHPDLLERPFALLPVADVAPEWPLPDPTGAIVRASERASPWRASPERVPFRTRRTAEVVTELVGIVNLTPDSFSDGGLWLEPAAAIRHGEALAEAGAAVLDLGAESTRPGAAPVDPVTEWARLEPVLAALRARWPIGSGPLLSIDTRHPEVAARALGAGADWVNDVTGCADPAMVAAVAGTRADVVVMHSLGIPPRADLTLDPARDPMTALLEWGAERLAALGQRGIGPERIIVDPGIGFGKTPAQTAEILARTGELRRLGARVLVGHSRKSFLTRWFPEIGTDREIETIAIAGHLAGNGVDYLRVHDVGAIGRALRAAAMAGAVVRYAAG